MRVVKYTPATRITNMDAMPRGTGARYLEVLEHFDGTYIAKQYRRSLKSVTTEIVIEFKGGTRT